MATLSSKPTATLGATATEVLDAARALLPGIASGSAERERERTMPYDVIRRLAEVGTLTLRVPVQFGGPGASLLELFALLVDLAAADSNVAQALRPSFLFVEHLRRSESEEEKEKWFSRVLEGQVLGNAGWERGARNGEVRARLSARDDHFVANGTKSYSTGALFADWVSTVAVDDDGQRVSFTVPVDRAGLHRLDDWDGFGQRLTASGTTQLEDVVVYPEELRRRVASGGRSPGTAVAQLFLAAVLSGIARNALDDAVSFAREVARPIVHAGVDRSVDDPYVRQVVGTMSARAFASEASVLRAASSIDSALDCESEAPGSQLLTTAALDVARAQSYAAEAALANATDLFEVGGASTTLTRFNLDRHWRNARTVANHNPRAHKASVLGAWHLTGAEPPTSGLF